MTCEQLRIEKNRAYVEYLNAKDITEASEKLALWMERRLAYEDAYRQEIKGETIWR